MNYQRTIATVCQFSGTGIHTGAPVVVVCHPAPAGTGIVFNKRVFVTPKNLSHTSRATLLESDGIRVRTPEHFLSACFGLGISNLKVEVNAEEMPILDGSARPFVMGLQQAGIVDQAPAKEFLVREPVVVRDGEQTLLALPDDHLQFTYVLNYPHSFVGQQILTFRFSGKNYCDEIAPARTFGFEKEVQELLSRGLAKGGSLDNAVIVGDRGYLTPLRFADELVRHKIVDMIGDLSVLGSALKGHFIGIQTGHSQNMMLVKKLSHEQ